MHGKGSVSLRTNKFQLGCLPIATVQAATYVQAVCTYKYMVLRSKIYCEISGQTRHAGRVLGASRQSQANYLNGRRSSRAHAMHDPTLQKAASSRRQSEAPPLPVRSIDLLGTASCSHRLLVPHMHGAEERTHPPTRLNELLLVFLSST